MKKLVASMAFVAAVLYGTSARAAAVDVTVCGSVTASCPVLDQLSFTVNTPGTVGSVSLHLDPAHGTTFTPTSIVSAADSVLTGEFIIINAPAGAPFNGTAGATGTFVLGVFTGATLSPCNPGTCMPSNGLYEDPASLGPTVLDGALANPVSNTFRIVPEPGSVVLLGIAAAGLALVRRKA